MKIISNIGVKPNKLRKRKFKNLQKKINRQINKNKIQAQRKI